VPTMQHCTSLASTDRRNPMITFGPHPSSSDLEFPQTEPSRVLRLWQPANASALSRLEPDGG
jgi:hypothetical protein